MADINNSKWMEEDILNVAPPPDGIPAGTPPTALYDILRADKGAIKRKDSRENPRKISNGTGAAYVITYDVGPSEFIRGDRYAFVAHVANTGAASLKVNAQSARSIINNDGTPLSANQIAKDQIVEVAFDGTSFRLLSSNTANPKFTGNMSLENATVSGALSFRKDGDKIIQFDQADGTRSASIYSDDTHLKLLVESADGIKETVFRSDGQLLLPTVPTLDNAAVTKAYVENKAVLAGKGLTGGGSLAGNITITLGTPTTITSSTTNSVTETGHTHALTLVSGDITGALGYAPQTPAQVSSAITTATNGNMAGRAYPRRSDGAAINFAWSGQGGQPTWLWGGSDGTNMYVYNPANFNVNSVGGWTQATISNQIENRAAAWARQEAGYKKPLPYTGDWENNPDFPVGTIVGYITPWNTVPNTYRDIYVGVSSAGIGNNYTSVTGTSVRLSGVWRHRGIVGQQGSGGWWGGIAERVG